MEQYKEGHYDDDLTVGIDEYDDLNTGNIDLFDYVGDEDSPLSRLKSLVLSIDWEITDEILLQFNEELHDLHDIWAGNKINLIYVQALEKLSRYIYKEKASSHPNAIKLLLTFYANLEKIVSDESMSEQEKKNTLREDIERFEKLKKQISPQPVAAAPASKMKEVPASVEVERSPVKHGESDAISEAIVPFADLEVGKPGEKDPLLNLKAIVYGIDWEITEKDLENLGREVKILENEFKTSKVKQIFLQGIGSLGAYINLKRSDAHADAFQLLHSFFAGLETVVRDNLSGQAEKNLLLPEVEKFNAFKASVAETISPDAMARSAQEDESIYDYDEEIQPAFSDVPDDVHGYQEEEESEELKGDGKGVHDDIDDYFDEDDEVEQEDQDDKELASEMESRLSGMFDGPSKEEAAGFDAEIALQGVNVETDADDDTDEDPLPLEDGELVPALAAEEKPYEESPAVFADKVDDFFEEPEAELDLIGKEVPGINVDHEADDETDEEPLPFEDGEYAPALSGDRGEQYHDHGDGRELDVADVAEGTDIENRLDNFFGGSDEPSEDIDSSVGEAAETVKAVGETGDIEDRLTDFFGETDAELSRGSTEEALNGIDVETAEDDDSEEDLLPYENGEIAPALMEEDKGWADEQRADSEALMAETFHDAEEDVREQETPVAGMREKEAVDERFDELFGDEEESVGIDDWEETEDDSVIQFSDVPAENHTEEQVIQGVDVETEEDDDSEEEPLLFEDGELAPALAKDEEEIVTEDEEEQTDAEAAETEISDRFDSFFSGVEAEEPTVSEDVSADEEEPVSEDLFADEEETLTEDLFADKEEIVTEDLFDEEEEKDEILWEEEKDEILWEDEEDIAPFEEAGFEEISDEDIEEIPEELISIGEEEETDEDDEILALLGDDDVEPAFAEYPDEDIPEIAAEALSEAIVGNDAVRAAGDVPFGYPSTDELLREFGEIAGMDEEDLITHPEGNEDFIIGIEGLDTIDEEEDVVFEPVAEDEEMNEEMHFEQEDWAESEYEDDDSQYFGTTLLADEPAPRIPEASSEHMVASSEFTMEPVKAALSGEEDRSAYINEPQSDLPIEDTLDGLRSCIISLGLEINDDILGSLNEEIEKLRHAWLNKPAEKTFVQLLSTIANHIEKYRYEADAEANGLLLSVFDKLELCVLGQAAGNEVQEAILGETSKVLYWQTRLINRTPAVRENAKQKAEPHGIKDAEPVTAGVRAGDTGGMVGKGFSGDGLDEMYNKVDEIGNDILMQKVSSIMKAELDQMKNDFKAELRELKEEIRRRNT